MGYILGTHHAILAGSLHGPAAQAGEGRGRKAAPQAFDEFGAAVVARGLARQNKYPRIALGRDGFQSTAMTECTPSPRTLVPKCSRIRSYGQSLGYKRLACKCQIFKELMLS